MTRSQLSRRNFQQLTAAALGGLVAGATVGCGGNAEPENKATPPQDENGAPPQEGGDTRGKQPQGSGARGQETSGNNSELSDEQLIMLEEPHVCRGLNACEGMGAGKDNACAGQGACATAVAHDCHEMNECKGQGGCGDTAGRNACKGQGECGVPLKEETWVKARRAYEQAMQTAGNAFGDPPAKS